MENLIDPKDYRSWVGFARYFCRGCKYENGSLEMSEDQRIKNCNGCVPILDQIYYKERLPIIVTKDEDGKNLAALAGSV